MLRLTRLDGTTFLLNARLIATIEEAADTVIHLEHGASIMVKETSTDVVERIVAWERGLRFAAGEH